MGTKLDNHLGVPSGIGQRLREARQALGMSQDDLATAVGCSRATQSNYETELTPIPSDYLDAFGRVGGDWVYVLLGVRPGRAPAPDQGPDLLRRVLVWAEEFCRDRNGRPIAPQARIDFIVEAYTSLRKTNDRTTDAEILSQIFKRQRAA